MRNVLAYLIALVGVSSISLAATIEPLPDNGGWTATGKTYVARVNADGGLVSLRMGDVELIGTDPKIKTVGAPFPGGKPASVNLRDTIIAVRNQTARLEYAFGDTSINVETEGAAWNCLLGTPIVAYVHEDGSVKAYTGNSFGGAKRFIVGNAAFEISEGFHYFAQGGSKTIGRLSPSAIPGNRKKATDKFSFKIEFGLSADTTALIEVKSLIAPGHDNKTAPSFKRGQPVTYDIELANLGDKPRDVVLRYTLGSHYHRGKQSERVAIPAVTLAAKQKQKTSFQVAVDQPGLHWLNAEITVDGAVVSREQRAFLFAADEYKPKLTRPDDFREFWKKQLDTLRAEPMNPKVTEDPAKSTDKATFSVVEIQVRGQTYKANLSVPKKPGKYMAVMGGRPTNRETNKADDDTKIIFSLGHEGWPGQATFTRWVSESDNNLLDCYLLAVRLTDYLRSRDDVSRIYLTGGSRQGPIQIANAALDPTKIAATEPHVPTCMGISWPDYPYYGWGSVPKDPLMARYVDPTNFAPDMTVPYIIDLGAYDGLSPVPGGLAFHNYAVNSPLRRFNVELGGHGFFTSSFKKTAKAEVEAFLKEKTDSSIDDKILKDH